MRFLEPIPDLGPCEGRWRSAFGSPRACTYRASESFDAPCGHVHRLCATCTFALERGLGTWDETEDELEFGVPPGRGSSSGGAGDAPLGPPFTNAFPAVHVRRGRATRRRTEHIPLHVAFAGIGALAALIGVGLSGSVLTAPMALGTATVLYTLALRHTWQR